METVFQYRLPVWHPQAVHFPVALLLTAALVALIWVLHNSATWRTMLLVLLLLSFGTGILAFQTGERLLEEVEGTPVVEALVAAHESSAKASLVVSGLAGLALGLYSFARSRRNASVVDPLLVRLIFLAAVLASAALIAWTAHIGGTMVWGVPR